MICQWSLNNLDSRSREVKSEIGCIPLGVPVDVGAEEMKPDLRPQFCILYLLLPLVSDAFVRMFTYVVGVKCYQGVDLMSNWVSKLAGNEEEPFRIPISRYIEIDCSLLNRPITQAPPLR